MSTSGVISFSLPIPVVTIGDRPTLQITLPTFSLEMTGGGYFAELVLPVLEILMEGESRGGFLLMDLPTPTVLMSASYPAVIGNIKMTLPVMQLAMGGSNYKASIEIILPPLVFSTLSPFKGTLALTLPVLDIFSYGSVSLAAKTYQGVVMNMVRKAITTYSGFPMNSMAFFEGKYIGATSSGIYTLGGNLDNTSIIKATLKSGVLDFGSRFITHIRDIWLTYRSNGNIAIVLEADEDTTNPVEMITQISDSKIHEERLGAGTGGVPRGFKGRFYTIELKNIDGSSLDLNEISILVDAIRRKLR